MTTRTTNRIDRCFRVMEARTWGEHAAMHNDPESTCPYVVGSYLWCLWHEAFERTRAKLAAHDAILAAAHVAVVEQRITEQSERHDAVDEQPQWTLTGFIKWLMGVE